MSQLATCELTENGRVIGEFSARKRGDFDIHIAQDFREFLQCTPSIIIYMVLEDGSSIGVFPDLQENILRGRI
jgi:hypothetical protein